MSRYTGPKNRIARRFGTNIFTRARNPLLHKPSPPGQHGGKRRKKSDFGIQLEEQQKLKAAYGMLSSKQLIRYYRQALRAKENTPRSFLQRLECRLDTVVYRLRFASTIFMAQQLVAHGHVRVDGRKVDIRSFPVRPGMTIAIKEAAQKIPAIQQAQQNVARQVPEYLTLQAGKLAGILTRLPEEDAIPLPLPIDVSMVCARLAHTS